MPTHAPIASPVLPAPSRPHQRSSKTPRSAWTCSCWAGWRPAGSPRWCAGSWEVARRGLGPTRPGTGGWSCGRPARAKRAFTWIPDDGWRLLAESPLPTRPPGLDVDRAPGSIAAWQASSVSGKQLPGPHLRRAVCGDGGATRPQPGAGRRSTEDPRGRSVPNGGAP